MDLNLTIGRWDLYVLVLARISAALGVAPVINTRALPVQAKVGLAVLLTLLIAPLHTANAAPMGDWMALAFGVAREVVIGLLMGFTGALVFSAVQVATRLIGVQVGLSMAGTMDPLWSESATVIETFYGMLAAIIFLTIGGHHALISAIAKSFDVVPLGQFIPVAITSDRLITISGTAISAGLGLAIPVVGALLMTDVAMGILARSMPQINIFAVSMPIKMIVGLVAMVGVIPTTAGGLAELSRSVGAAIVAVIR